MRDLAVRNGTGGRWCPYAHKKWGVFLVYELSSSYTVFSGLLLLIVIGLAVGEQGSPIAPLGVDTFSVI